MNQCIHFLNDYNYKITGMQTKKEIGSRTNTIQNYLVLYVFDTTIFEIDVVFVCICVVFML